MKASNTSRMYERLSSHATWMVKKSALRSRRELAAWIMPALSPIAAKAFKEILPLYSFAQIDAEKRLCAFLNAQYAISAEKQRRRVNERAGRETDWAYTFERSIFVIPLQYHSTVVEEHPDLSVMRALVTLANHWSNILKRAGFQERYRRLRQALRHVHPEWRRVEAMTQRTLSRIDLHDASLGAALRGALSYWEGTSTESDADAFGKALKTAIENEHKALAAHDNKLFELDVMWGIVRAIVDGSSKDDNAIPWTLTKDPLNLQESEITSEFGEVALFLECEDLRCRITKTKPSELLNRRLTSVDRVAALARAHGVNASGFEPDIVFHFTHKKYPNQHLFALADPKNYHKSPIIEAIKSTGAAYLLAFAPLFGTSVNKDEYLGFQSAVRPAVTLFFANQNLTHVAGEDATNLRSLKQVFQHEALPPIMALDERHFADPHGSSERWNAPVICSWFERITHDVTTAFEEGRAYEA